MIKLVYLVWYYYIGDRVKFKICFLEEGGGGGGNIIEDKRMINDLGYLVLGDVRYFLYLVMLICYYIF